MGGLSRRLGPLGWRGRQSGASFSASEVARLAEGAVLPAPRASLTGMIRRLVSPRETDALYRRARRSLRSKVACCVVLALVVAFLSLGVMGASGEDYPYTSRYALFSPAQVVAALGEHAYQAIASLTHGFEPHSDQWVTENVPGYWAVPYRAAVLGITALGGVLLSVSGALYQCAFRNPLAGPGMLGVGSGVSFGMMLMVLLYGASAPAMVENRYWVSYGAGLAILAFVIIAGRRLSGKGRPFDVVAMLLLGSILSQLMGFVVNYVTLFLMDEEDYLVFYTLSQMLVVDTSPVSWIALGTASLVSLVPVWVLRHRLTALTLDDQDAKSLGVPIAALRAVALAAGAVMVLAAQIHIGAVGLVSLIVPFLARRWFGCAFPQQLVGCVAIGVPLLLIVRTVTDLIPFVGDGFAIGSVMSVAALPLFVFVMVSSLKDGERL